MPCWRNINNLYKEEVLNLTISNEQYSIIQITNIDEVFDALINSDKETKEYKDERIPYWTEIWPSALAMSKFILENAELIKGKKIIEIGAGLGLPSIVASKLCKEIVITDYLEDALTFAEKNAKMNDCNNMKFQVLDWRNILMSNQKYDIILASDVAYEKRFFDELPTAFLNLMHDQSIVLFTEPGRQFTENFIGSLSDLFFVEKTNLPTVWRDVDTKVSLYKLKKR
jgi:predicted nicotinamide N-methyase